MVDWHRYFTYRDGLLIWKHRPEAHQSVNTKLVGKPAGSLREDGYIRVRLNDHAYYAHVIVFEMHNGPVPEGYDVDHRDLDRSNNRIENLRLATRSQNKANGKVYRTSSTGVKGVLYHKRMEKYQVSITANGVTTHIGTFNSFAEAKRARLKAQAQFHGEFSR